MAQTLTAAAGGLDSTVGRDLTLVADVSAPVPAAPPAAEGHPGMPPEGLVPRERLVRRLMDARALPVLLLVAPAGYGKTALLRQWTACDERPFAWVALEWADNDPRPLLSAIALALDAIEPVGQEVFDALSSRRRDRNTVALRLLTASLERRQIPGVLVLDDLQVLQTDGARATVAALGQACGRGLQLALASRSHAVLPAARLRAHGHALEMRAGELAMTRSEAAGLMQLAQIELAPRQLLELHNLTEGWPAGLQLAARFLHEQGSARLSEFSGSDRAVADYVREEMLATLSPDEREFVLGTSVLDRITAPICNELLGREDAADMLARLSRANMMLTPLDRSGASYRYPELVAAALRAELRQLPVTREAKLHARASSWYESNADPAGAIEHAVAAGDNNRAATLLWENALGLLSKLGSTAVDGWLDRLSPRTLADTPLLCLVGAASELIAGDFYEAERWTTLARSAPGDERALAGGALLQAAVGRARVAELASAAEAASGPLEADGPWHSLCLFLRGSAELLLDNDERAVDLLTDGAHLSAVEAPLIQVLCLAQLALRAEDGDDLERAEALAARARAQVGRCDLSGFPPVALVFVVSAEAAARSGREADASADLRQAFDLFGAMTDPSPWYAGEFLALVARTTLRLSGPAPARELVARAERALRGIPDAARLQRWLDDTGARIQLTLDAAQGAEWNLTSAELRVLRHLPSHLSFREIAERLYVSQNTVKTHARGIYRKLGVASRGEAVELARRAALVDRADAA